MLFLLYEAIGFFLLFQFNRYQSSVFFTAANSISGTIYECRDGITEYFSLREKNRMLTETNVMQTLQLEYLHQKLHAYTTDTTDIESFKNAVLIDYDLIPGRVINNSIKQRDNYITINKGSSDGVKEEMGVIDGNGVVGIIYLTSSHYSIIIPVLNSKSSISCKVKRTDYFGLLQWDGANAEYAYLNDLPRHAEFALGDTIVTSGYSTVFPAGIPIGTINDIADSSDGLSYSLRIKLQADFSRLGDVTVIGKKNLEEWIELENNIHK